MKEMNKPINQMDTLSDMTRFPWTVHLGASLNIVFSIWLTYQVFRFTGGRFFFFLPFAVTLIALNVIPVILMRRNDPESINFRNLGEMDFFKDQHRFSTWVYAIASGNMLFWTVFAWWAFTIYSSPATLLATQAIAFVVTYVPLWRSFLPWAKG
jgi:hypothetical protein